MAVSPTHEIAGERRRHQELHQRAAQKSDDLTERTEEEMARFVDRQVDRQVEIVEEAEVFGMAKEGEAVDCEQCRESQPGVPGQGVRTERR